MSLKSTRKRLKEYFDLLKYKPEDEGKYTSVLSKVGMNPENISEINGQDADLVVKNTIEKKQSVENYIDTAKMQNAKKEAYQIKIDPNEKNITKKIKFSDDDKNINMIEKNKAKENDKQKKGKYKILILMAIVELFTLLVIFGVGTVIRFSNSTQEVPFDVSNVVNKEIDSQTLKKMQGYRSIAIFGLDSRTGSVTKGNNSDVNIIANINYDNGEVKLVSIYRDLYLSVDDNNKYGKYNSAYFYGGPEGALKSLNKNLDLNITNYVSFNWKAVADGISMLGGIDLEIKKSEYKYMNAFIQETCIATGIDKDNPAAHYIKKTGMQHLDGIQAVAYARLRLMDSDFQRVERQKKVIELCLEKAKTLDFNSIMGIAISIIPTVSYNFDWAELSSLVKSIDSIHIVESTGFPSSKYFTSMKMGASGDCVIPYPLNKAVTELHEILYGDVDYKPSKSVNAYSGRIIELKEKYEEENRIEESRIAREMKESLEEQERRELYGDKATRSIVKRKKATSSTSSKNTDKIVDYEEYEEYEAEPEDDNKIKDNNAPVSKKDNQGPSASNDNNAPYNSNKNNTNKVTVQDSPIGPGENIEEINTSPPGSSNNNNNNSYVSPFSPTPRSSDSPISPISNGNSVPNSPSSSGNVDVAVNAPPFNGNTGSNTPNNTVSSNAPNNMVNPSPFNGNTSQNAPSSPTSVNVPTSPNISVNPPSFSGNDDVIIVSPPMG